MKVPQFMPFLGSDEYSEIKDCFDQNWITEGPKSAQFLEELLNLTGAKHGVFAPNGTLAIYLALIASGIKPGDKVIVPDFTFLGSASAVVMAGGEPVFCDVNPDNFQVDLESAERVVDSRTKFIMPVHVYGTCCNMKEVMDFAERHNLKIIEDAAQAIGVKLGGQHAGTFGVAGTFSFFADKTITTGEGGLVVTNDSAVYESLRYLRNQGRIDRGSFIHPHIGYNFRITDMQAAVGLRQLSKLEEIKSRKRAIWDYYHNELCDIECISFFKPNPDANFIPFRVAILSESKRAIDSALEAAGVETRSFFYPMRRQPCFSDVRCDKKDEYTSDFAFDNGICLPSYVSLTEEQLAYVCSAIKDAL